MLHQQGFINKLWQQLFELGGFGVVDVVDDIGEPLLWINIPGFTGTEEAVKHSYMLSRLVIPGKKVVFASQGQGADFVFNKIAVNFQHTIFEVVLQTDPSACTVFKSHTDRTPGQDLISFIVDVGTNLIDNRQ